MRPIVSLTRHASVAIALAAMTTSLAFADVPAGLASAIATTQKATSYHVSIAAATGTTEADIVEPDRIHSVSPKSELIAIGPTLYVKVGGAWRQIAGGGAQLAPMDVPRQIASHLPDITATDLGMKTVDGQTLHDFHTDDPKLKQTSTVYVDGSGRIVRVETGTTIVRLSNFNESVTITAPM